MWPHIKYSGLKSGRAKALPALLLALALAEILSLASGVEVSASVTEGGGSTPAREHSGGEASAAVTGGIGSSLETERSKGKVSNTSHPKGIKER